MAMLKQLKKLIRNLILCALIWFEGMMKTMNWGVGAFVFVSLASW